MISCPSPLVHSRCCLAAIISKWRWWAFFSRWAQLTGWVSISGFDFWWHRDFFQVLKDCFLVSISILSIDSDSGWPWLTPSYLSSFLSLDRWCQHVVPTISSCGWFQWSVHCWFHVGRNDVVHDVNLRPKISETYGRTAGGRWSLWW